jgi:hypothetical protein
MMRTDAATARLSELVCAAGGIKGKSGNPLTAEELMPWTDRDDPDRFATEEDMKRMFRIKD